MSRYSIAEARHALPRLIDRALAGEEVVITRRGKVVAEVRAKDEQPLPEGALDRLFAMQKKWPAIPGPTSVELLRGMYEEAERERGY